MLTDVWLGSRPGKSPWSEKAGRTYDIRTDTYGPSKYSIAANRKRIGPGTTGWICHRDGSFGAITGLFVFDGGAEVHAELLFMTGLVFPLPREYWIDGARIQFNPNEQREPAGPFKPWPDKRKWGCRRGQQRRGSPPPLAPRRGGVARAAHCNCIDPASLTATNRFAQRSR